MKKLLFIAIIFSLFLMFSFSALATTSAISSNTFEFNHVTSIDPLATLLGFGSVNYNSNHEAVNASVSLLGIPILSENFTFLQPLKLDAVNPYWDTMTILSIPFGVGIGTQYIMKSGFFVGGDLDLSILGLLIANNNLWYGNLYAGMYY